MKTSLNIEDEIFNAARLESIKTGKTLSDVICLWARAGRKFFLTRKKKRKDFCPVDLGDEAQIDLSSRKDWMEALDDNRGRKK